MADSTINDLQTYSKEDAIGGFFPLQKGNGNGKFPFANITNVIDIVYESTPFATLKAAYDNGQSVRISGIYGSNSTLTPVFYQEESGLDNVVEFGTIEANPVSGKVQYLIIKVVKGEGGASDTWSGYNETIGTQDVKIVSVDSSSWTGAHTYTMSLYDGGKIVDFGSVPAAVTGLTIKIPSGVNSAYFKFTLPTSTTFASLSVTDASYNELKIINESKPSEFAAGDTIIASVMCGDVAYGVSKAEA